MEVFNKSGLYVIAGIKGVGKTSFLASLIEEYQKEDAQKYSLYCYNSAVGANPPIISERLKIIELSELPIQTGHIFLDSEWSKSDHGLATVIVDDFRTMLRTERFSHIELTREEKILYLLTRMKSLSDAYDIPVIITCGVDDDYIYGRLDKRPHISDIPDHKYIKAISDRIILMHRDEMFTDSFEKKGITEFGVHSMPDATYKDYRLVYIPERDRYCRIENC